MIDPNDPFEDGESAVSKFEGQSIARRNISDLTHGDRALDPTPRGVLERFFNSGATRAASEAEKRTEHARALARLGNAKADAQIALERAFRANKIGATRANAEIAENEAVQAASIAKREMAITKARAAHELAEMDLDIERAKRSIELAKLRKKEKELGMPVVYKKQLPEPEPDHPIIAQMKAEYGTYHRVKLALRKARRELEEQRGLISEEEYEDKLSFLEIREAEVLSHILAGEA